MYIEFDSSVVDMRKGSREILLGIKTEASTAAAGRWATKNYYPVLTFLL